MTGEPSPEDEDVDLDVTSRIVRRFPMSTITRGWIWGAMLVGALGCSTSNVGSDASADAGPISDPVAFCKSSKSSECDRAYECVPLATRDVDFMTIYGSSLTDCKSMIDAICTDPATNCPTFDTASAGSCAAALTSESCSDLVFGNRVVPPDSCSAACGM